MHQGVLPPELPCTECTSSNRHMSWPHMVQAEQLHLQQLVDNKAPPSHTVTRYEVDHASLMTTSSTHTDRCSCTVPIHPLQPNLLHSVWGFAVH